MLNKQLVNSETLKKVLLEFQIIYTLNDVGLFEPKFGKIWTNPNIGLKILTQLQLLLST